MTRDELIAERERLKAALRPASERAARRAAVADGASALLAGIEPPKLPTRDELLLRLEQVGHALAEGD